MPWIPRPPETATEHEKLSGVLEPLLQSPSTLAGVIDLNKAVTFGGSSLGRRREELISVTVSALNDCFY